MLVVWAVLLLLRFRLGLPRLQGLLLGCVLVRQLLRLLLVFLFHLLRPRVICILPCQLLMFRILLLLQTLPFLGLLSD